MTTPKETKIITQCDDAILLAGRGIPIFPAKEKKPLVKWKDEATTDTQQINKWWTQWPDAEIGVPMPLGTVAVDIDDLEAVKSAGLDWTLTQRQQTRSGGWHMFYKTDGRRPPQVVKRNGIALDTRVGGLGYVIAYDVDAFLPPLWAPAPEWVYETEKSTQPISPVTQTAVMGTRDDIIEWLGGLAAKNPTFTMQDFLSLLTTAQTEGRLVNLDLARPWKNKDLRALAHEAAGWAKEGSEWWAECGVTADNADRVQKGVDVFFTQAVNMPETVKNAAAPAVRQMVDAADLLTRIIAPARDAVPGLLPEGLGVLAAPPKSGKSVLAYQLAVELTLGHEILGKDVEQRPVMYYALEDGERRSQGRIMAALGDRDLPRGLILRWDAPPLGGPLEQEVSDYLDQNQIGVVIVDVLAAVRPTSGSKASNLNAYDADYGLLTPMRTVAHNHPGSVILFVTHDRKAGADDWMSRITGTRGVTGVADFCVYINRDRGKPTGAIYVTGRDVEDGSFNVKFTGTSWQVADTDTLLTSVSDTREAIWNFVEANEGATPKEVADGTGLNHAVVRNRMVDMVRSGQLARNDGGYVAVEADDTGHWGA